jgi:hypothetical protein
MTTFATVIDKVPPSARKLVTVEYSYDSKGYEVSVGETLWCDNEMRFYLEKDSYSSLFFEYHIIDILNWLDDIIGLEPHLYTCYEGELLNLIEDLEMIAESRID